MKLLKNCYPTAILHRKYQPISVLSKTNLDNLLPLVAGFYNSPRSLADNRTLRLQANQSSNPSAQAQPNQSSNPSAQAQSSNPATQAQHHQVQPEGEMNREQQQQRDQRYQDDLERSIAELMNLGITDYTLAGQLAKSHVQGHYLELAFNDLSTAVRDHRALTEQHSTAFQEILNKLSRMEQQIGVQGGPRGGYRPEKTPAEIRCQTMKCLLQPPAVWTMKGDLTQDFTSWREQLETKLKTAAVDLLRDRAVINAWIWGLLDKHLQTGAEDLRPYLYDQTPWHEYVDLLEQKFAPANIRNFNIYLFKATKQKENQTILEFHGDLHRAYQRAGYQDQMVFYDQFLQGCINKKLKWKLIEDDRTRTIAGMRQFLIETQSKFLDAGKYIQEPGWTQGLSQFSSSTNQYIQKQIRPRQGPIRDTEVPMDISQVSEDLPFFQHTIDQGIWQEETQEEKSYWEEEGGEGLILALSRANQDPAGKTCFHCRAKGHFKATCPQRRTQALNKRRDSTQRSGGAPQQGSGAGSRGGAGGPREARGSNSNQARTQPRRPQINSVSSPAEDPELGATLALQEETSEAQPQVF